TSTLLHSLPIPLPPQTTLFPYTTLFRSYDSTGQNEYNFGKPYSEETARTIDQEVSKLVEEQYARAKRILTENKDKLTALATQLRSEEHTSELQSRENLVCRLLLEKKRKK